ncbi:unnamed protein product, partial [Amoebophrya sp. A120]
GPDGFVAGRRRGCACCLARPATASARIGAGLRSPLLARDLRRGGEQSRKRESRATGPIRIVKNEERRHKEHRGHAGHAPAATVVPASFRRARPLVLFFIPAAIATSLAGCHCVLCPAAHVGACPACLVGGPPQHSSTQRRHVASRLFIVLSSGVALAR